ncbi:flavin-containing monooxygenase [Nonomuraea purpurea]|uniref:Flavin-containing monooxygenase n=1 Tax=Nonomuraea purpurea TaxID=1849276 RepID=A0ABV8FZV2_9ACTN
MMDTLSVATGQKVAAEWLGDFASALEARDAEAVRKLFLPDGHWRDILALTWDLRTFSGPDRIAAGLLEAARTPLNLALEDGGPQIYERRNWGRTIETFVTFETDYAWCRAHLRLLSDGERWRAWTLCTSMEQLKGFEERAGHHRPTEVGQGAESEPRDPRVLVIGAGQAGLTVAARLGRLNVDTLVIEREARVGDNWRNRYQSLVLHNQVWANHLPYLPFPSSWPVYITKDQLADWLETYASILPLNVWTSAEVLDAAYDERQGLWTVRVRREDGTVRTLRPRHLVQATGVFGVPDRPEIRGAEDFRGVLTHATEYRGAAEHEKGLRVLVVGSGSSAHDVAQDLCEAGAHVTMLQRSSTCVVSVDPGAARAYSIYAEDGIPLRDADLINNAFPFPLLAELHKEMTRRIADMDAALLDGLRRAGFALDFGEDGSGFLMKYHRHGGGYYINVGCSDLIAAGRVRVKQGVEIERLTADSAVFTDGDRLEVDMVVVATGYQNMSESIRMLLGDEVADRVGPVWGLDAEGEVRAMWRRTGQPGFWLAGGSLQQCRPYSKYLALQIKGEEERLIG